MGTLLMPQRISAVDSFLGAVALPLSLPNNPVSSCVPFLASISHHFPAINFPLRTATHTSPIWVWAEISSLLKWNCSPPPAHSWAEGAFCAPLPPWPHDFSFSSHCCYFLLHPNPQAAFLPILLQFTCFTPKCTRLPGWSRIGWVI